MAGTASTTIWYTWTTNSNITSTCASTDTTWIPWCTTSGGNTAETYSTTCAVWKMWSDSSTCYTGAVTVRPKELTPEERVEYEARLARERELRLQQQAEYEKRIAEQEAKRRKAERRAAKLIRELLDTKQRADFDRDKRFFLVAASGKRYEVDCERQMHNVYEVDENGKRIEEHCIYANGDVPLSDNAAAQLLLLQSDEKTFRRIANQRRVA